MSCLLRIARNVLDRCGQTDLSDSKSMYEYHQSYVLNDSMSAVGVVVKNSHKAGCPCSSLAYLLLNIPENYICLY